MTHDEWWATIGIKEANITGVLMLAFKELTKKAWDASRNCRKCGRELPLAYCPNCDQ